MRFSAAQRCNARLDHMRRRIKIRLANFHMDDLAALCFQCPCPRAHLKCQLCA